MSPQKTPPHTPFIYIMHYVTYHNSTNFFELAGHLVSTPSNLHDTVGWMIAALTWCRDTGTRGGGRGSRTSEGTRREAPGCAAEVAGGGCVGRS